MIVEMINSVMILPRQRWICIRNKHWTTHISIQKLHSIFDMWIASVITNRRLFPVQRRIQWTRLIVDSHSQTINGPWQCFPYSKTVRPKCVSRPESMNVYKYISVTWLCLPLTRIIISKETETERRGQVLTQDCPSKNKTQSRESPSPWISSCLQTTAASYLAEIWQTFLSNTLGPPIVIQESGNSHIWSTASCLCREE